MKKVLIISMALNLCLFGKYKELKRKNELLKVQFFIHFIVITIK